MVGVGKNVCMDRKSIDLPGNIGLSLAVSSSKCLPLVVLSPVTWRPEAKDHIWGFSKYTELNPPSKVALLFSNVQLKPVMLSWINIVGILPHIFFWQQFLCFDHFTRGCGSLMMFQFYLVFLFHFAWNAFFSVWTRFSFFIQTKLPHRCKSQSWSIQKKWMGGSQCSCIIFSIHCKYR